MMLDPEAVISAMEDSMNLRRLRQRICRPLDKPLIPKTHGVDRVIQRKLRHGDRHRRIHGHGH